MSLTQNQIRKIIQLRGFGYNEDDIAKKLNISRKTVSNRLMRLKAQAEQMFEEGKSLDLIFYTIYGLQIYLK